MGRYYFNSSNIWNKRYRTNYKYGINFNTTAKNWVGKDLSQKELAPFIKLKSKDNKNNPISIFLGDYFKWDPLETFNIAKKIWL